MAGKEANLMARSPTETVTMTHKEHGTADVPVGKVEILEASGWKLKKTTTKVKEVVDGES